MLLLKLCGLGMVKMTEDIAWRNWLKIGAFPADQISFSSSDGLSCMPCNTPADINIADKKQSSSWIHALSRRRQMTDVTDVTGVSLTDRTLLLFPCTPLELMTSQWWGHKRRTHQRHERSVKVAVSGFSRCTLTCNFTHCESHNGLTRAQNSNLSVLASETMWYQPILIELLAVLLLLRQHTHFSSSRRVSMRTLGCSRNVVMLTYTKHATVRKVHPSLSKSSFFKLFVKFAD
jgi:hypothetical protein